MPQTKLFTARDLEDFLQDFVDKIDENRATVLERIVWGWLKPTLGTETRPDEDDTVFAWAVELGAIAHENPAGLTAAQLGAERIQFSAERRQQILDEAATVTGGAPAAGGADIPRGTFPRPSRIFDGILGSSC